MEEKIALAEKNNEIKIVCSIGLQFSIVY